MCTVPKGGTPGEQRLLPSVSILREIPRDIIAAPGSIGRVAIQVLEGASRVLWACYRHDTSSLSSAILPKPTVIMLAAGICRMIALEACHTQTQLAGLIGRPQHRITQDCIKKSKRGNYRRTNSAMRIKSPAPPCLCRLYSFTAKE